MKQRTDKEMIDSLNFMDMYDIAYRLEELKKLLANEKRKNTILEKKLNNWTWIPNQEEL